jgi:hypothetical protein
MPLGVWVRLGSARYEEELPVLDVDQWLVGTGVTRTANALRFILRRLVRKATPGNAVRPSAIMRWVSHFQGSGLYRQKERSCFR